VTDKIVVLTTCDSKAAADELARKLVENRVAACVNIVTGVRSVYRWKDKVEAAREWMLVIKSRRDLFVLLRAEIEKLHGYEVPEIVALPVVEGAEPYLSWLDSELLPRS
jgi:periplasmic divalent cation tolerance protein